MERPEEKMRFTKELYVDIAGNLKIESVRFGMFSGNGIRKSAEVQVYEEKIHREDSKPVENGLLDTRMGISNQGVECNTCHGRLANCPGHFGCLKLALPVFNIAFFNCVLDVLKCMCKSCSRVLLVEKDRRDFLQEMRNPKADALQKSNIMKKVIDKCVLSCYPCCGYINGVVKKSGSDDNSS